MSERCSNCEGKVVLSKAGLIILLLVVAWFSYQVGVIRTDDKWEEKSLTNSESTVDPEYQFQSKGNLMPQLEACENKLRSAAKLGYDEDGVPLDFLWDSYWNDWKRYED